jgi:hypothetical protein
MNRVLFMLALLAPAAALADLPPPDGEKFVDYGFRLQNLNAFPEYVLLAYPWSLSDGAPTTEHTPVEDTKIVYVGSRSETPQLYAMKKGEYEAWRAEFQPTHDDDEPQLAKLFARESVVLCNAKLHPEFALPKSDPRKVILETFRVEAIDEKTCRIAALTKPPAKLSKGKAGGCAERTFSFADPRSAADCSRRKGSICWRPYLPNRFQPSSGLAATRRWSRRLHTNENADPNATRRRFSVSRSMSREI